MGFLQAFILAITEGITEFLPISSTGHLILVSKIISLSQTDFVKTFEIAIQAGTILSVIVLYAARLLKEWGILKRVIWAFIPTGILGLLLYKVIKQYLIGNFLLTVSSLLIGGILIIIFEKYFKKNEKSKKIIDLSLKKSALLGVIQTLSVIPGVSRSAATIFGGMFLGLSRKEATELSFMIAIPTLLAATGLDLVKSINSINTSELGILIFGTVISFITAIAVIKWLLAYIKTHDFILFGIYRIIIAIIFFALFRI